MKLNDTTLKKADPEVYGAISLELKREQECLVLIASENYASRAVMEAQATVLTNKYAEGYPGARYYGGCEFVDVVERLAVERAKGLFGAEYVNVQAHSGSQANMAVYLAALEPGDLILGMDLSHGGHLTHGSPVSFSGKVYKAIHYGVRREDHLIDFDQVRELARKHRPKIIVAGASAYPRIVDFHTFRQIADEVEAYLMVDMAHIAGLVATNLHPSPVGVADFITSTTHKTLRGPRGGFILAMEKYSKSLDKAIFPGIQGGPLMHVIAAKAVAFGEAMSASFGQYQRQVILNAKALADGLASEGFELVAGGTDNHMVLVDLTNMGLTGQEAERLLEEVGIAANKNAVPFDTRPPRVTSGLRLGTPAMTTRGMKEGEMREVARLIASVLKAPGDENVKSLVTLKVKELCSAYPIYTYQGEEA